MEVLWETLGFAAKGVVVFSTIAASTIVFFAVARRGRQDSETLQLKRINDRMRRIGEMLRSGVMDSKAYKKHRKAVAKADKTRDKQLPNVFVIDFS